MRSLAIPGVFGGRVGALRAPERAVILTAVRSLRRACSERWRPYRTLDYVIGVDLG